jgi:iron complex outermembrane receptor protein
VVVTATKGIKSVQDAPGSVSVLTIDDIDKKSVQTLEGALKYLPGIFISKDFDFSTLSPNINIRGISGNRTLVMVDGQPLNDGRAGSVYIDGVPMETVDQIEAVKGPFSALYGSTGMAGVINIRTIMPDKRVFNSSVGYGSGFKRGEAYDDVASFNVMYGDLIKEKFSFLVAYNRRQTNGFSYQKTVSTTAPQAGLTGYQPTTNYNGARAYVYGDKGDGYQWQDAITTKLQYEFDRGSKLLFSFMKVRNDTVYNEPHTIVQNAAGNPVYYPNVYTYLPTSSGRERNFYKATYEDKFGNISTTFSIGLVDTYKYYNRTPSTGATWAGGRGTLLWAPNKSYSAELTFSAPIFGNQLLTWGFDYKYDTTDGVTYVLSNWQNEHSKIGFNNKEGGKARTFAIYVQDEIELTDKLKVYLGGRVDWWKTWAGYYITNTLDNRFPARSMNIY